MEGGAAREEQSIGSRVNQGRAECMGVKVVEQSVDWKTPFTNHTWSILQAAAYQASGVMPYKHLGKISDNLHPNNQNNWLERRAQPS